MRKLAICSSAIFVLLSQQSVAITPEELTRSLYTKMANIVMPNGNRMELGKSYFVIANPGIVVGNPSDFGGEVALEQLISQVDKVPMQSPFYEEGIFHLTQLYQRTFDQMSVPEPADGQQLRAEFEALTALEKGALKSTIEQLTKLEDELGDVEAEIDEYRRAQADAKGVKPETISIPVSLTNKRRTARRNLDQFPGMLTVADHINKKSLIETKLPFAFKAKLKQKYDFNNTGQEFPRYVFYPPVNIWDTVTWTTYKMKETDLKTVSVDEFKSVSGRAGFAGGFGGLFGGKGGGSEKWQWSDIEGTDISLEFQLGRVGIHRPWFDPVILTSKRWRFDAGDVACNLWSDGSFDEDNDSSSREKELMPFYVKSLILAKNLKLAGKWNKDFKSEYTKTQSLGGRVRFGFFSAGASKSYTYTKKESRSQVSDAGIENPDIQIIGFIVQPLGKTPNPSDTDGWPNPLPNCP